MSTPNDLEQEVRHENGFEWFSKDGKLARRTFVKGVGLVTVASAFGFGAAGCSGSTTAPASGATGATTDSSAKTVNTFCTYNCMSNCQLKGTIRDGRIVAVEPGQMLGRDDYANCCLRGISYPQRIQDETVRTMYPMKRTGERGSGEFERITWDEAMNTIAEKLNAVLEKDPSAATFYYFTGNMAKIAWEAPMRMAKCLGATLWACEAIMGDHGATMGMVMCYGAGRAGHDTRDYMNSELMLMWGNHMDTHTSETRYLLNARDKGAKYIVVDPRMSSTASRADQWVPIMPQTDAALAIGMIKIIIDNDLHDKTWLQNYSCAPLLVSNETGQYIHPREGIYAAWDTATNAMVEIDPADAGGEDDGSSGPESTLALTGTFEVDGVVCHPTFDDLVAEAAKFDLERVSALTGLEASIIENLALEYAKAKPAAIRMAQGTQRSNYSFQSFKAIATLGAITGNIGKKGGGAGHVYSQGMGNPFKPVESDAPAPNFVNWDTTGGEEVVPAYLTAIQTTNVTFKTSYFYESAIEGTIVPIDFLWIATSNFVNMSPDLNKIINEVFPAIDFIVCADPFWTLTAKYSDIVLPAKSNWENWDINARPPWIQLNQPHIEPMGESLSDCEMMTMLAPLVGEEEHWMNTDEEWVRDMVTTEHPGFADFDWEQFKADGMYARADGIYDVPAYSWGNKVFGTPSKRFEFYTESLFSHGWHVPTYGPRHEDPASELGQKYPLIFLQYHDRITIHSQNILADSLRIVATEPQLSMHPTDAAARGIAHDDVIRIFNDRGECKVKAFLTEGIVPGCVALPHGWTPDYFIEGNYQFLTHYKKNEVEEAYSQTSTAFYDVLVQIEKA